MPVKRDRLSFDRIADIFEDQRALPPGALAALHTAFADLVDSDLTTLVEPGAGTGRIAIPALAAGFRVTAVDISAPMLAVLEQRLAEIPALRAQCEIVIGDAVALPFGDNTFDAGLLAQVLYLIPNWERALDELARVVRPGGRILLVQERTRMSPELVRWDSAWREMTAQAGHDASPPVPNDDRAVAALRERTTDVTVRDLASWGFGQSVGNASAGLDRLRTLHDALDDDAWQVALAGFRAWHATSGLADDTWLGGTVTLTLVTGTAECDL